MNKELKALYDFIKPEKNSILPEGLHSYPNFDENNDKIHNACLELEKDGLIYRWIDTDNHVFWMPKKREVI